MNFQISLSLNTAFCALLLASPVTATESDTESATENTATVDQASIVPANESDKVQGLDVWGKIYQVLSHPRCVNCHVPDDRPRWSGQSYDKSYGQSNGKPRVHGMNVQATETRIGTPGQQMCTTCHAKTNSDVPHGPPGAKVWALAPAEMIWWGKSSKELCAMVKDPAQTGGRDIAAFADHIGHDALVAWAWDPGVGREPAPFSVNETVTMLEQWRVLGLPCPE